MKKCHEYRKLEVSDNLHGGGGKEKVNVIAAVSVGEGYGSKFSKYWVDPKFYEEGVKFKCTSV